MGLTWDNIDFSENKIVINKAVVRPNGINRYEKSTKTNSSRRIILLPKKLSNMLAEWKDIYKKNLATWLKRNPSLAKKQYIIVNPTNGIPLNPATFAGWLSDYIKRNNFEHISPHKLRHFYVSFLYSKGITGKLLSDTAGHANENTTMSVYTSVSKEDYEKVRAILDSV